MNNTIYTPIHITEKHTGKMQGMSSISSSCTNNPNCQRYRNVDGFVCQRCFACSQLKRYKNSVAIFEKNGDILSNRLLDAQELPTINARYFRFECFGDLHNVTMFTNYCEIARKNPLTRFAIWTKNANYINKYVNDGGMIPDNLNIILSSFKLNEPTRFNFTTFDFKVFTVYENEQKANEQNKTINCGGRKCSDCLRCYEKNDIKEINELLK